MAGDEEAEEYLEVDHEDSLRGGREAVLPPQRQKAGEVVGADSGGVA